MKHRRAVVLVTGGLGVAVILGASHILSAQQAPASNRPASEQVAKVNLAEVGLPAAPPL